MKNYSCLITIISCLVSCSARANAINDPEQNFLSHLSREPNCLWKMQADLNTDDYPEILLSLNTFRNGKAGHIWQVYAGTKDGYLPIRENLSFRTDAVFIGYIDELKEKGLLAYFPASSSQGALVAFHIKQNHLVESNLGKIRSHGSDATKYKKYFSSSKQSLEKKPLYGGKCSKF